MMAALESEQKATPRAHTHAGTPEPLADVQIAEVIAQAVCEVPGVAALAAGRLGTVATYGPRQTVRGVVVRRELDDSCTVEIHIHAAGAELVKAPTSQVAEREEVEAEASALLPALAEAIRRRLMTALVDRGATLPAAIDVYFDDLD